MLSDNPGQETVSRNYWSNKNTNNTNDNWMLGWSNFDPVNANYDYVVTQPTTGVANLISSFSGARVFPNPATNSATVSVLMTETANVEIIVRDITGKLVKEVFNGRQTKGNQSFNIDLAGMTTGLYMISVSSGNNQKTIKLNVIN